MRPTMLLLALTVLSGGAPGGSTAKKPDRQSTAQADKQRKALGDRVARGRRTDLRDQRLGDFNLPGSDHAYA
ncbi:MAG TPA: hypothetical protein VGG91_03330 [Myxococcaceae bacterium]